jgi:bacterioferritin-associated ferredoxin
VIVCHCNVIAVREIEAAIRDILARDPGAPLSPPAIYRELGKRGRCCGCFPQVEQVVEKLLATVLISDYVELTGADPA